LPAFLPRLPALPRLVLPLLLSSLPEAHDTMGQGGGDTRVKYPSHDHTVLSITTYSNVSLIDSNRWLCVPVSLPMSSLGTPVRGDSLLYIYNINIYLYLSI
jgi:hypothetical protein